MKKNIFSVNKLQTEFKKVLSKLGIDKNSSSRLSSVVLDSSNEKFLNEFEEKRINEKKIVECLKLLENKVCVKTLIFLRDLICGSYSFVDSKKINVKNSALSDNIVKSPIYNFKKQDHCEQSSRKDVVSDIIKSYDNSKNFNGTNFQSKGVVIDLLNKPYRYKESDDKNYYKSNDVKSDNKGPSLNFDKKSDNEKESGSTKFINKANILVLNNFSHKVNSVDTENTYDNGKKSCFENIETLNKSNPANKIKACNLLIPNHERKNYNASKLSELKNIPLENSYKIRSNFKNDLKINDIAKNSKFMDDEYKKIDMCHTDNLNYLNKKSYRNTLFYDIFKAHNGPFILISSINKIMTYMRENKFNSSILLNISNEDILSEYINSIYSIVKFVNVINKKKEIIKSKKNIECQISNNNEDEIDSKTDVFSDFDIIRIVNIVHTIGVYPVSFFNLLSLYFEYRPVYLRFLLGPPTYFKSNELRNTKNNIGNLKGDNIQKLSNNDLNSENQYCFQTTHCCISNTLFYLIFRNFVGKRIMYAMSQDKTYGNIIKYAIKIINLENESKLFKDDRNLKNISINTYGNNMNKYNKGCGLGNSYSLMNNFYDTSKIKIDGTTKNILNESNINVFDSEISERKFKNRDKCEFLMQNSGNLNVNNNGYYFKNRIPKCTKNELNNCAKNERQNYTKNEIKNYGKHEMKDCIKNEMKNYVTNEMKNYVKNDMKDCTKNEIQNHGKNEMKDCTKNKIIKYFKNEMKDCTKNEMKNYVKNEMKNIVKNEIQNPGKNENCTKKGIENFTKNENEKHTYNNFQTTSTNNNNIKNCTKNEMQNSTLNNFKTSSTNSNNFKNCTKNGIENRAINNSQTSSTNNNNFKNCTKNGIENSTLNNFKTTSTNNNNLKNYSHVESINKNGFKLIHDINKCKSITKNGFDLISTAKSSILISNGMNNKEDIIETENDDVRLYNGDSSINSDFYNVLLATPMDFLNDLDKSKKTKDKRISDVVNLNDSKLSVKISDGHPKFYNPYNDDKNRTVNNFDIIENQNKRKGRRNGILSIHENNLYMDFSQNNNNLINKKENTFDHTLKNQDIIQKNTGISYTENHIHENNNKHNIDSSRTYLGDSDNISIILRERIKVMQKLEILLGEVETIENIKMIPCIIEHFLFSNDQNKLEVQKMMYNQELIEDMEVLRKQNSRMEKVLLNVTKEKDNIEKKLNEIIKKEKLANNSENPKIIERSKRFNNNNKIIEIIDKLKKDVDDECLKNISNEIIKSIEGIKTSNLSNEPINIIKNINFNRNLCSENIPKTSNEFINKNSVYHNVKIEEYNKSKNNICNDIDNRNTTDHKKGNEEYYGTKNNNNNENKNKIIINGKEEYYGTKNNYNNENKNKIIINGKEEYYGTKNDYNNDNKNKKIINGKEEYYGTKNNYNNENKNKIIINGKEEYYGTKNDYNNENKNKIIINGNEEYYGTKNDYNNENKNKIIINGKEEYYGTKNNYNNENNYLTGNNEKNGEYCKSENNKNLNDAFNHKKISDSHFDLKIHNDHKKEEEFKNTNDISKRKEISINEESIKNKSIINVNQKVSVNNNISDIMDRLKIDIDNESNISQGIKNISNLNGNQKESNNINTNKNFNSEKEVIVVKNNNQALDDKKTSTPSVKTRAGPPSRKKKTQIVYEKYYKKEYPPLRWKKINIKGTIFENIFEKIKAETIAKKIEIDDLKAFEKQTEEIKTESENKLNEKEIFSKKIKVILPTKKGNAIGIALAKIKNENDFIYKIWKENCKDIPEIVIKQILGNYPTEEEFEMMKGIKENEKTGTGEEFFIKTLEKFYVQNSKNKVADLKEMWEIAPAFFNVFRRKLQILHFCTVYSQLSTNLKNNIETLNKIYITALKSEGIKEFIRLTVFIGNAINGKSFLGNAEGFSIESINEIIEYTGLNNFNDKMIINDNNQENKINKILKDNDKCIQTIDEKYVDNINEKCMCEQHKNEDIKNEDNVDKDIKNEYTRNEYTKNEDTKNEDIKNEDNVDKDIKNEYTKNEYTKNEYTKNEYTKNEYIKNEYIKNECTKNEKSFCKSNFNDVNKKTNFCININNKNKSCINTNKNKIEESNEKSCIKNKYGLTKGTHDKCNKNINKNEMYINKNETYINKNEMLINKNEMLINKNEKYINKNEKLVDKKINHVKTNKKTKKRLLDFILERMDEKNRKILIEDLEIMCKDKIVYENILTEIGEINQLYCEIDNNHAIDNKRKEIENWIYIYLNNENESTGINFNIEKIENEEKKLKCFETLTKDFKKLKIEFDKFTKTYKEFASYFASSEAIQFFSKLLKEIKNV